MDGQSLNILDEKLSKLKDIIPEAFTENKIDWEKLKAALGEDINFENERYNLNWAGKSDAFRALQQRTSATLKPVKEESVNFDETENLFIEGENLEVLKVLQKSYFGKIKMIYIDPPYNTGNDSFIYPDKFSETKDEYLKRIGDKDEEGYLLKEGFFRKNSKDSGHYHSNWLSMMYPRLYIARNLLRDDGVIFVSIDDNEVHNLRMIMNEIFGEENFIGALVWEKKKKGAYLSSDLTNIKEYIMVFTKNKKEFNGLVGEIAREKETYPVIKTTNARGIRIIPKGIESKYREKNHIVKAGTRLTNGNMEMILLSDLEIKDGILANDVKIDSNWIYSQNLLKEYADTKELYITQDLYFRRIVTEPREKKLKDILPRVGENEESGSRFILNENLFLDGWGTNEDGNSELHEILGVQNLFEFPKPTKLLAKIIYSLNDKDCTIIDFFSGSGTTAQAVFELNKEDGGNRKFILVQLPEQTDENSEAFKAGYKTIADICKERIRRVITRLNSTTANKLDSTDSQDESQEKLFENPVNPEIPLNPASHPSGETERGPGFKVFKLSSSNFKHWRSDIIENEEDLGKMFGLFDTQLKDVETSRGLSMLYELMLKSGYTLTDKVEDKNGWYLVSGNLVIVLKEVNQTIIDEILKIKPQTCIILDDLFAGNDQLKTNTALQMKDVGLELITV